MRILFILMALLINPLFAQSIQNSPKEFFKGKSRIKDPLHLRDPFKSPLKKALKVSIQSADYRQGKFKDTTPLIDIDPSSLIITGVFIGKNRRATALIGKSGKEGDSNTIILREGMKLGVDKAEVKAILPGGIVLVEKIENVYGQSEYLETVIPISEVVIKEK